MPLLLHHPAHHHRRHHRRRRDAPARHQRHRLLLLLASSGWNAIVQPALSTAAVERLSASQLRVTIASSPAYAIDSPETVL
mmetsp:Transcript_42379/g.117286  ORF Transcript_42379/g.117286 Transcript_42379/m.117286 type:complete len:81 (-) Transcript_42379:120-362(-)